MTGRNGKTWRVSVAAFAVAAAVGAGFLTIGTAWADASPADKAAAIDEVNKAKDLYQQEKYVQAAAENDRALKLDPDNGDAQLLQKILQSKVAEQPTGANGTSTKSTATGPAGKSRMLTPQQISLIRIQELAPTDTQVRGKIDRKVLQEFWDKVVKLQTNQDLSIDAYNAFMSPNNFAKQVQMIKDSDNQKYISQVQFSSDPATMVAFKSVIHPFVLKNCATSACHGGEKGGSFRLFIPSSTPSDQVLYTNFYILAMYTAGGGKMINRDDPTKSLFLQYALPKNAAKFAHPGTVEIRRFADESAPEIQAMAKWVQTLAFPQPNYGIVYELPHGTITPTTAPAPAKAATTPQR